MLEALQMSLPIESVIGFTMYIVTAALLMILFQFAYSLVTPHKELRLIREGNTAAAIALGGALIGFALPASNVITHSVSLLDFLVWALIAGVVQLLAFLVGHLVLKNLGDRIHNGELAAGIYMACVAVAFGLLNAACMTPSTN